MDNTQKIIYDIVEKFAYFCESNNLDYFINYGSLLGAVRHKGFIPWDDDFDVVMKRQDLYEFETKYLASDLQKQGYTLQSRRTYKFKAEDTTRIRNSNIPIREVQSSTQEGNIGPWIDIFAFDNIPDDITLRNKQMDKIMFYNKLIKFFLLVDVVETDQGLKRVVKNIVKFFNEKFYKINILLPYLFKKRYLITTMYNDMDTEYCAELSYIHRDSREKFYINYKKNIDFYARINIQFEGLLLKAPKNKEEMLTLLYGDYMKIPSEEERRTHSLETVEQ